MDQVTITITRDDYKIVVQQGDITVTDFSFRTGRGSSRSSEPNIENHPDIHDEIKEALCSTFFCFDVMQALETVAEEVEEGGQE